MKTIKIFFVLQFTIALTANAQNWKGVGGGMDNGILCFYTDTFSHVLYAGGSFNQAGGINCSKIAKWDGSSWTDVGGGVFNDVRSITSDSGYIYVAVDNFVGRCNTSGVWSPMLSFSAVVNIVKVVNGELYAGGDFFYQGTTPVHHIAKWNGTSWDSLGPGVGESQNPCFVDAITEYQGHLVVGGAFKLSGTDTMFNIAMWDGTDWHSMGNGLRSSNNSNPCIVYDLYAHGNDLYAAGRFVYAGYAGGLTVNGIAKWDGTSWHNLGNGAFANGSSQTVQKVIEHNNELFAIGGFNINYWLVKWNGINWNSYYNGEFYGGASCMAFYNNEFYVGDVSLTDTNGQILNHVARRATFDLANDSLTCSNSCNGTAGAPDLGVEPDNYVWSNGETTQNITGLCTSSYGVTVTDSTGSISTGVVTITSPPAIAVTTDSTNATCSTCNNGTATITASGGSPPYSYLWSNGATTNSIDSLLQGIYAVTITDNNNCVIIDTVTVGFDVGMQQLIMDSGQLIIYPNPAENQLIIDSGPQVGTIGSEQLAVSNIEIVDLLGRVVLKQSVTPEAKRVELNVSAINSGVYFVKVYSIQGSVTARKFIKQ